MANNDMTERSIFNVILRNNVSSVEFYFSYYPARNFRICKYALMDLIEEFSEKPRFQCRVESELRSSR